MESTVYIQAVNKFPFDDWACDAYLGWRDNGANIKLYEDINDVPANKYSIVVGCIEDTTQWFRNANIPIPGPMTMPEELRKYARREINILPLGDALQISRYPFFIKPYSTLKQFWYGIIKCDADKIHFNKDIPLDSTVLISEVVPMDAEYRCYIIDGKIIGVHYYLGDFKLYPDVNLVEKMIEDYTKAPRAYCIDVAVQKETGNTILVECNDGWSLGNYGLPPKLYVRFLTTRWREIITQNKI